MVAGAVLLTPGVVTDAVGFLLLVPFLRRWLGRLVQAWAARRFRIVKAMPEGAVKDAEVVSVRDPDADPDPDYSEPKGNGPPAGE